VRSTEWNDRTKQSVLEAAYGPAVGNNTWRVQGFTNAVINALRESDWDFGSVKPVRSHIHQRRVTYMNVINSDMTAEEALDYIWERDVAIMSLRSENKDDGSLKLDHPIDQTLGLFKSGSVGYSCSKKREIKYLQENF
uniref:hypothetical protein n=1 Tax=Lentibacter algarum TaxID=576131 RepID=UPI002353B821